MQRIILHEHTKIPLHLTVAQRDLIREHTLYDPDFARDITPASGSIRLDMTYDDIEYLQGYVAAEANHCDDRDLEEKLDRLHSMLQDMLDTYDVRET